MWLCTPCAAARLRTLGSSPGSISVPTLAPLTWALNHHLIIWKGNLHADFHCFTEHGFDCTGFVFFPSTWF